VGLNMAQKPARSFLHDNKALELRLEASDRVTHQLSTAVFAIFIREVLGYRNVTVTKRRDAFNVSAVLSRMAGCSNPIKFVFFCSKFKLIILYRFACLAIFVTTYCITL
jgi:hypothetical protein